MLLHQIQHGVVTSSDHFGVVSLEYTMSNFTINFHKIPGRSFIKVLIVPHSTEAQIRNYTGLMHWRQD